VFNLFIKSFSLKAFRSKQFAKGHLLKAVRSKLLVYFGLIAHKIKRSLLRCSLLQCSLVQHSLLQRSLLQRSLFQCSVYPKCSVLQKCSVPVWSVSASLPLTSTANPAGIV